MALWKLSKKWAANVPGAIVMWKIEYTPWKWLTFSTYLMFSLLLKCVASSCQDWKSSLRPLEKKVDAWDFKMISKLFEINHLQVISWFSNNCQSVHDWPPQQTQPKRRLFDVKRKFRRLCFYKFQWDFNVCGVQLEVLVSAQLSFVIVSMLAYKY